MTGTSTTSDTRTVGKTAPIAAAAVAAYAAEHGLDYHGLDLPHGGDEPAIVIRATEQEADAWIDAVDATDVPEIRRPAEVTSGRELVVHRGLLPCSIGRVPVAIWSSRKTVPLRLVGATS